MISFEEAYKKAKQYKSNINNCTEYENGYVFGSSEDDGYIGGIGHTPVVILKKSAEAIPMNMFIIDGTGKKIRDIDI